MEGTTPLFRRLIGEPFERLPREIRAIHEGGASRSFSGRCDVQRGTHPLSRLCGKVAMMPPAAQACELRVSIQDRDGAETWRRQFGRHALSSRLCDRDGLLEERMGAMTFRFRLVAGDAIEWRLEGVRALGVPLPLSWFRGIAARESLEAGRYAFDVRVELPVAGLLVHYRGTLDP